MSKQDAFRPLVFVAYHAMECFHLLLTRPLIDRMLALEETRDVLQQAVDRRNEELVIRNQINQQACRC